MVYQPFHAAISNPKDSHYNRCEASEYEEY